MAVIRRVDLDFFHPFKLISCLFSAYCKNYLYWYFYSILYVGGKISFFILFIHSLSPSYVCSSMHLFVYLSTCIMNEDNYDNFCNYSHPCTPILQATLKCTYSIDHRLGMDNSFVRIHVRIQSQLYTKYIYMYNSYGAHISSLVSSVNTS